MKKSFILSLIIFFSIAQSVLAKSVEIEVHGMTCAFCVDSLERKFKQMESVSKVQVSLKAKKVRFEINEESPNIEKIRQTVLDAGFTPIKISLLEDEKG